MSLYFSSPKGSHIAIQKNNQQKESKHSLSLQALYLHFYTLLYE